MGQCYAVEADVSYKNGPEGWCKVIREEITARNGKTAIFRPSADLDTAIGCFRALTCEDAEEKRPGVMSAWFTASYGWEAVMVETFMAAARELRDGSVIRIFPDGAEHRIAVESGKILHEYVENDELEEGNDESY